MRAPSLLRASAPRCETCVLSALALLAVLSPRTIVADDAIQLVAGPDRKIIAIEAALDDAAAKALRQAEPSARVWQEALAVYVAPGGQGVPPIVGDYALNGTLIRFTPRYAFRPGVTYRAVLHRQIRNAAAGSPSMQKDFTIPEPPRGEPTRVTAIYPSADVLPENQLRFYIHFSAPMSRGEAFDHIQLLGPGGKPDPRAFFQITGEELWDGNQQRLTVLLDPGRVKKGLSPHLEHGPVLRAGNQYTLAVGQDWRDADGRPLAAPFEKRFTAGPAVEMALDHKQWRIQPPAVGSRDPLVIEFPHPLDNALLARTITIESPSGQTASGDIAIANHERRFEFRPAASWTAGRYHLVIDTVLEDTAGNRLGRPFEVDVFERVDRNSDPEYVRVPFSIAPGP